jgi:hypothetical protein
MKILDTFLMSGDYERSISLLHALELNPTVLGANKITVQLRLCRSYTKRLWFSEAQQVLEGLKPMCVPVGNPGTVRNFFFFFWVKFFFFLGVEIVYEIFGIKCT